MRMRNSSRNMLTTQKEYEVADILLCLPQLIVCTGPTPGIASLLLSSSWGCKRRRSAIFDEKEVAVVNNNIPAAATTPLNIDLNASPSHQPLFRKQRCNYESKSKTTKLKLLDKYDMLRDRRDVLTREIGKVSEYYDKLLIENSILKDVKQQLKKCDIEEGKTRIVMKSSEKCENAAAAVFPSQRDKSFMYPTTQRCQAFPPKDRYPLGGNPGLKRSCNGLAIGREMDPSIWPQTYELEGRIGVGQVNKCQGNEASKRRMIKSK